MKKFASVLLALTLILALASCNNGTTPSSSGESGQPESSAAENSSTEPGTDGKTVEFWDMAWGGNDQYIVEAQAICKAFTEETGINVTYQSVPWDNWYQTYVTAIASDTNPDVSTGSGYQAFQFTKTGNIEPLDDIVDEWTESGEIDDFIDGAFELMYYEDHYRAIPWMTDARPIFYNMDLLKKYNVEVPTTWDEFYDACVACTSGDDYGFILPSDGMGKQIIYDFMFNNGGGIFEKDGSVGVYSQENKDAVAFLDSLYDAGCIYPASSGMAANDTKPIFEGGNLAFYVQSASYGDAAFDNCNFEMGMLKPLKSPNGTYGGYYTVNNMMVYSNSDCKTEAKEFLKYYNHNELPLFTKGAANGIPVRKSFYEDPFYVDSHFMTRVMEEWIPVGGNVAWKLTSNFPELNEIDGLTEWTDLVQGIAMGADTDPLLQAVDAGVRSAMGE